MFSISKIEGRKLLSLRGWSYFYLYLPLLIFALNWFNIWFAILFAGVLVFGFIRLLAHNKSITAFANRDLKKVVSFTALVALIWILPSGMAGLGYQNYDFEKHNAVLKDLIQKPWPVIYGDNIYLIYYMAFYLPAALVGKIFGSWWLTHAAFFAWTFCGLMLSLLWFVRSLPKKFFYLLALFPLFSGMDALGFYLIQGYIPNLGDHWEWWSRFAQFSANTTLLFWVPQHAMAAWIGAGLILEAYEDQTRLPTLGLVVAPMVLWSPFVTIGLMILVLPLLVTHLKRFLSLENLLLAPLVAASCAIFISGNALKINHGWLLSDYDFVNKWPEFVLFFLLEFLVMAVLGLLIMWRSRTYENKNFRQFINDHALFFYVMAGLIFCTSYNMGAANDLTMRASIPLLFVFWLFMAKFIVALTEQMNRKSFAVVFFILSILLGSFTNISEYFRGVRAFPSQLPQMEAIKSVNEMQFGDQYLSSTSSWYSRYFAK